jgi:hypothetical protein
MMTNLDWRSWPPATDVNLLAVKTLLLCSKVKFYIEVIIEIDERKKDTAVLDQFVEEIVLY